VLIFAFQQDEPRIYVESEDQPERMLLETKIVKDDGYQKQQGQTPDTRVLSDNQFDICCRHVNSMDGDKWHRHGIELPRSRWLRGHLVRMSTVLTLRQSR
jgi:protein phosphatase-4 regulatory subunit 3